MRTPPIVLGEENKVRQVVTNLLGNARRFSPEDGPIEIVVDSDRVRGTGSIAIVDHGEGIPPQIREQIFERFWRADTSRARETGGSGLGLAIVASIMKALHGGVDVSETPGGGATFTVTLPSPRLVRLPSTFSKTRSPWNDSTCPDGAVTPVVHSLWPGRPRARLRASAPS
ncbi:cell wall metabolism sensor histidine kinase WalK [Microbacterium sp. Se5.02b]|uniref:sensor histidine kinase n=1 Tax=Microbacterium sp. Se5.02b TaxID=2864103 RepID=UPI00215DA48C|nr:ATP-binding protein [Microbacterium sp. Se5.02b]